MPTLVLLALAGFGAQLVDGALGMGYGVTSTTLLLLAGLSPAAASASVHFAKIGTALASGWAHWRFDNIDPKLVLRLGVPGAVGALIGALLLSGLSSAASAPLMAGLLVALGVFILVKYTVRPPRQAVARVSPHGHRFLAPVGLVGGFVDATGGGGWGPVVTSSLLTAGRTAPRTVIGSVSASEFVVAVAASAGFVIGLGHAGIDWLAVVGLLLGGVIAAPLAAWLVTRLPATVLGVAVGGLIVLSNLRILLDVGGFSGPAVPAAHVVVALVSVVLVGVAARRLRATRRASAQAAVAGARGGRPWVSRTWSRSGPPVACTRSTSSVAEHRPARSRPLVPLLLRSSSVMRTLIVFAIVGFGAQLVDGALGMAYGVTSTSLLLVAGVNPATASASVHLAEVGTTLVAGASHWRFGNVDWKLVLRLGVPGAVGAFLGATALSALATDDAAPYMSGVLLALGVYILLRFSIRPPKVATQRVSPHRSKFLSPLGLVAGFVDASGGGGWGPVATPALLTAGKTAPRTVIGSVDTSEFLVALAASVGFLIGLGTEVLDPATIGGLLIGGVLAAPLAAWLVTKIPAPILGTAVGGIIILTNTRTILRALDITGWASTTIYLFIVGVWAAAVAIAVSKFRSGPRETVGDPTTGRPVASSGEVIDDERS